MQKTINVQYFIISINNLGTIIFDYFIITPIRNIKISIINADFIFETDLKDSATKIAEKVFQWWMKQLFLKLVGNSSRIEP